LIPEPFEDDAPAVLEVADLLPAPTFPLCDPPALMGCCSKRVSSAAVFPFVFAGFGIAAVDLRGAGMADFGVSALVLALTESGSDLADERPEEVCAVARATPAVNVINKHTAL
jgi:hypothetical protein